jgi:hypothetical protein
MLESLVCAVTHLQGIKDPCGLINPVIHPRNSLFAIIDGAGSLSARMLRFGNGDSRTHRVDFTPD